MVAQGASGYIYYTPLHSSIGINSLPLGNLWIYGILIYFCLVSDYTSTTIYRPEI